MSAPQIGTEIFLSIILFLKGVNDNLEEEARKRVKYTLPGPMTIMDCIIDQFYGEEKKKDLINDLIKVINQEILSLAKHGCQYIHLDEPVLMRYPENALEYGVKDVSRCFEGKAISFMQLKLINQILIAEYNPVI